MKNEYCYPAIFTEEENGISIEFPDLPGCLPSADNLDSAFSAAREALGLHLFGMEEDGDPIPPPSPVSAIRVPEGSVLAAVDVFMPIFRDNVRRSTVKKTLTIPYWLNARAEKLGINFSQVLQDALRAQIGAK